MVRQKDGSFRGYNTDYVAAIGAIEKALDPTIPRDAAETTDSKALKGKTVLVLGAGGAARGLAFGAKFKEANVVVANRSKDRADALAEAVLPPTKAASGLGEAHTRCVSSSSTPMELW